MPDTPNVRDLRDFSAMRQLIESIVNAAIAAATQSGALDLAYTPEAAVERPRDGSHGDWASTIALRLAKELGRSPRDIAAIIVDHIKTGMQGGLSAPADDSAPLAALTQARLIESVNIAGPGFINFKLSAWALQQIVRDAYELDSDFARSNVGGGQTINVEFVSANPTGPMHVGHGRWAALGNAICNVLEHSGWQVTREFYVNDAGRQIELFAQSVAASYLTLCGKDAHPPADGYGGSYVAHIAHDLYEEQGEKWATSSLEQLGEEASEFRDVALGRMLTNIKTVCERMGVNFDVWFSERSLYQKDAPLGLSAIEAVLQQLADGGYLYERDDAVWFRSTDFFDDKDRVLIKANGEYTYFAPDIAYHMSKFERECIPVGSEYLVDIWGADHHGYIPRMQAACAALGHEGKLTVVLGQLVNLFRSGQAVRMSKRTGEMVTLEELLAEVGADATKYLMLSRSADQPIDFDIEVAKRQDATNPVYYVQYAHARICSLLAKAAAQDLTLADAPAVQAINAPAAQAADMPTAEVEHAERDTPSIDQPAADLSLLIMEPELELARSIGRLAETVETCAHELAPYRLTHYAELLAATFHRFYTECQVIGPDRQLSLARLYLAEATRRVLALTLGLLGVNAPDKM
ncbi:MAG: arginine--tRNA ligase [Coriobacteriales bacterium]|jgi:arginyl-tRNA synthetase|nr:arginine--tRNA ligase [Coriobacteriales bacterium]